MQLMHIWCKMEKMEKWMHGINAHFSAGQNKKESHAHLVLDTKNAKMHTCKECKFKWCCA